MALPVKKANPNLLPIYKVGGPSPPLTLTVGTATTAGSVEVMGSFTVPDGLVFRGDAEFTGIVNADEVNATGALEAASADVAGDVEAANIEAAANLTASGANVNGSVSVTGTGSFGTLTVGSCSGC